MMKFACEQADLLAALGAVTRAMSARSTVAVFESVRVEATGDGLSLMCTDLSMGIETKIGALVEEEGCLLLPGRLLHEIVRKLPPGEVKVSKKDMGVTIRASGTRTNLQGLSPAEFPSMPQIDDASQLVIEQATLRDMIRQSAFAAAAEESNPTLTGVLIETEGTKITMVALDRYRFALRRGTLSQPAPALKAVVPARYLGELARMLSDEEGEVALGFSRTHVTMETGATTITIRLLDGEFVNYRQLIPSAQKTTALVDRAAFEACIERAALIARETKNNLINLSIEEDKVAVTSQSETSNFYEELPIQLQGGGLEIAFNVRYVSDAIRNLNDDQVALNFTTPVSPCVVTPLEGDSFLYLLLPVRVFGK